MTNNVVAQENIVTARLQKSRQLVERLEFIKPTRDSLSDGVGAMLETTLNILAEGNEITLWQPGDVVMVIDYYDKMVISLNRFQDAIRILKEHHPMTRQDVLSELERDIGPDHVYFHLLNGASESLLLARWRPIDSFGGSGVGLVGPRA